MIKKSLLLLLIAAFGLLASCASQPEKTKNPFDALTLKENLNEGKTSQTQILQTFGAPDIITESNFKEDIWTYNQVKHESSNRHIGGGLLGFIPVAGGALADVWGSTGSNESSSKSVTLMIYFNKQKVVKNYVLNRVKI